MDSNLIAFPLEMLVSISISGFVLFLLQPVLREILKELCRRETRAAFWTTFTRLMIFIAPLIVVVLFTKNTGQHFMELVETVRATLLHALLGQFIGLTIIGTVILRFSRDDNHRTYNANGEPG